jgi:hypothetical protein
MLKVGALSQQEGALCSFCWTCLQNLKTVNIMHRRPKNSSYRNPQNSGFAAVWVFFILFIQRVYPFVSRRFMFAQNLPILLSKYTFKCPLC